MLQPEIQISRDILCLPVTLLKALLRKTAPGRYWVQLCPQAKVCGEFHCGKELGLLRFMDPSCAKCKALEGGFWIFKTPVIAGVGIELEMQTCSWWFIAVIPLSSEMISGPASGLWNFPVWHWGLFLTNLTLTWSLLLSPLVQRPTCRRCILTFPFCYDLFYSQQSERINPHSSQKNKMYLLAHFLINSDGTFLIRMCQQSCNGILT